MYLNGEASGGPDRSGDVSSSEKHSLSASHQKKQMCCHSNGLHKEFNSAFQAYVISDWIT